jgi:protein phosphatase PTC7
MNAVAAPSQYPYILDRNIFTQQYLFNSLAAVSNTSGVRNMRNNQCTGKYTFLSGVCAIPQPGKTSQTGEDAYFITESAVGVADGVGGWNQLGVDPSLYSTSLMENAKEAVNLGITIPVQILSIAYENTTYITGSSTACILTLSDTELQSANLGDSGFMVIRGDEIVFKTKEQQHSFNFPYQLGTGSTDKPEHASVCTIQVQEGDIIVMGSDGLWDNVYDHEIVEILNAEEFKCDDLDPTRAANLIASKAHEVAVSPTIDSPFAVNAQKHDIQFNGGKMDDITVLVCRIVSTHSLEDSEDQPSSDSATSTPSSAPSSLTSSSELLHMRKRSRND